MSGPPALTKFASYPLGLTISRAERRALVLAAIANDPPQDAKLIRMTRTYEDIDAKVKDLEAISPSLLPIQVPAAIALAVIAENWGTFDLCPMLGHGSWEMRPEGNIETWDVKLLAMIAILSEFTPGQLRVCTLITSSVETRLAKTKGKDPTITAEDVKRVITDLIFNVIDNHPKRSTTLDMMPEDSDEEGWDKRFKHPYILD
ncbi:hypothetical protein P154DRAFT_532015 [Amniculicola lignicola CBS 123094]|uniref:Uncharacterized protein n=1 Tax=Amniculicola lignicola CBS 123094 TaxID=1392246 RepID=A0A6A5WX12_9PLEO|nr:hypothetical protein P154DRAFT_532015 [Amniculicola lignicola CBS 123094]